MKSAMTMELSGFQNLINPGCTNFDYVFNTRPLAPFSPLVIDLLNRVSEKLMDDKLLREFPDVATFAFWCRKASISLMKSKYLGIERRLGRGVIFHVAPSNVPVNFAYSLAAGLLAGNANIVRVPSAEFIQVQMIAEVFRQVLKTQSFVELRNHICLIRYDKSQTHITSELSERCNVRVIWGGDKSIQEIRRSPLSQRSYDVTFADRYSLCVIDADGYLSEKDFSKTALRFYNDTYLFDQNACTAPHLVFWVGSSVRVEQAKQMFWDELQSLVESKYDLQTVSAVDKLITAYLFVSQNPESQLAKSKDNLITRIKISSLDSGIENWRGKWGCFFEYQATNLESLSHIVNQRFQTLSYIGITPTDLEALVHEKRMTGVDRIVPVGQTLDFALDWDGYDLIRTFSRVISVF
jgi:hypothetical protein